MAPPATFFLGSYLSLAEPGKCTLKPVYTFRSKKGHVVVALCLGSFLVPALPLTKQDLSKSLNLPGSYLLYLINKKWLGRSLKFLSV